MIAGITLGGCSKKNADEYPDSGGDAKITMTTAANNAVGIILRSSETIDRRLLIKNVISDKLN
jgi:hypothetical protein